MAGGHVSIDGSFGEGGGSILRTALGLSAVTGRPVSMGNIRQNRPRPGLAAQHLTGLRALAKLYNARTEGAELGSGDVKFVPREAATGGINVDVGTAGSISLMLQALMIPLPFAGREMKLTLSGGTHVPWSPTIDYLSNVTIPILSRMGYSCSIEMRSPGYYPKGGGRATFATSPIRALRGLSLEDFGELREVRGISRASNLPDHVARRQASSAAAVLSPLHAAEIGVSIERALCPGSAITLWATTSTGCRLGASALGKRGRPAEEVGRGAGEEIKSYISDGAPLDPYLLDQIIPYAALAEGRTILRGVKLTNHAKTNIHVVRKFVDCEIEVEGALDGPCRLVIDGIGFEGG